MYRISLLPRKVLISVDEVIAQGPTDNNVDARTILSAIQIAEERFIKPAIYKELYNDFREKKSVVVTEGNKVALQASINAGNLGDLIVLKNGDIVNAIELVNNDWYVKLWNEYLWKLTAECVVYIASPTNWSRFTSSGEIINNPKTVAFQGDGQASSSVELKDMKWKLDKLLQDRIDPLIESMQEWICDNKEHFPLYKKKCSCEDGVSYKRKTGWLHNIYNDKKEDDCE